MQSSLTCQVCLLPLDECRENDKKLIKPFDKRFENQYINTTDIDERCWRVLYYINGSYNPDKDCYHYVHHVIGLHDNYYTWVKLPLCIWEGNQRMLKAVINMLHYVFMELLPIEQEYITILNQLAKDVASSYVSSLPTSPKPTKRFKTN